jgi:hypothetical protein
MNSIVALKDTLAILELVETIRTPSIDRALRAAAAEVLLAVASDISDQPQETRGPSLYNQFISEMNDSAKRALPKKAPKERFHILAALWTRHKDLGDLQDIKAAAQKDLKAHIPSSAPVYSVDMRA